MQRNPFSCLVLSLSTAYYLLTFLCFILNSSNMNNSTCAGGIQRTSINDVLQNMILAYIVESSNKISQLFNPTVTGLVKFSETSDDSNSYDCRTKNTSMIASYLTKHLKSFNTSLVSTANLAVTPHRCSYASKPDLNHFLCMDFFLTYCKIVLMPANCQPNK